MENFNSDITVKQGFFILFVIGVFGFIAFMISYGLQDIANNQSKNPHNLLEDCMYYVDVSKDRYNRNVLIVQIKNKEYRDVDIYANSNFGFPEEYREFILENKESCHKIRYININILSFNKIYVYGYD